MKQRVFTLVLTALLLAQPLTPSASAGGYFPFTPVRSYEEQFSDVSGTAWYYENVKALYELGLTNGQGSETRFAPEGDMTVAEALTVAARLRSLYEYGNSETGPRMYEGGETWYRPYVDYLQSLGVIGQEFDGKCGAAATRAQMAHILANALPRSLFVPLNGDIVSTAYFSREYITDVTAGTPFRQDILTLYEWGILSGLDRTGSFHPQETIPRCQAAAMVTRLVYEDLRIRLDWSCGPAYSLDGITMADLVYSDGSFYDAPAPNDLSEIEADVRYMLARGEREIALRYPADSLTKEYVEELMNAFLNTVRGFVEQTYNAVECSYSLRSGLVAVTFSSSLYAEEEIDSYREATMEYAVAVHDQLWEEGVITSNMAEYDKARAYFTWICENCDYDFSGAGVDSSMSHSGYRVFAEGLAVCDGYTAAYNLLLKLEGIDCTTWSTDGHIWTVAELDGTACHIDTTWGTQTGTVAYRYFAMTETDSLARFG